MFFSEWREVIAKLRMLQDLSARDMVRTTEVVSGEWRFAVKESKRRKLWLQKLFISEMQNTVRVFFQTWFDALRQKLWLQRLFTRDVVTTTEAYLEEWRLRAVDNRRRR
eukprot:2588012-Rhodomonas_salina.1